MNIRMKINRYIEIDEDEFSFQNIIFYLRASKARNQSKALKSITFQPHTPKPLDIVQIVVKRGKYYINFFGLSIFLFVTCVEHGIGSNIEY